MSITRSCSHLPINEQIDCFRSAVETNKTLIDVLKRAATLGLPNWYLAGGCLTQTVWNLVTGQEPENGIGDYDLVYLDDSDLSWEAEDAVIQKGLEVFAGIPAPVEIRNQARVHIWYAEKFGRHCPQHRSTEGAIDTWLSNTAMVGVRLELDGRWRIYAPLGFSDMFNLVVRPNPVISTRNAYERKLARWRKHWPAITVHSWPSEGAAVETGPTTETHEEEEEVAAKQ